MLRAAIVGCALNCADYAEAVARNIGGWATRIDLRAVIIVEGPSSDDTRDRLAAGLSEYEVRFLGAEFDARDLSRTERLARLRNRYLVALNPIRNDLDIVIVMDFDDVNATVVDVEGFGRAMDFMKENPAAAVFAHQSPHYYDIYALRSLDHPLHDCWKAVSRRPLWMSHSHALDVYVAGPQRKLGAATTPVEVASAFGGIAIYRARHLEGAVYAGEDPIIGPVCEHVALNRTVCANGGRLFVLPALHNRAPAYHLAPIRDRLPLLARIESPAALLRRGLAAIRRVSPSMNRGESRHEDSR